MAIEELKDLMCVGRMNEHWGIIDGGDYTITPELTARIFREFTQLRDEVDMLTELLSQPCGSTEGRYTTTITKEAPMDTDQRWLEQPYADQDARQAKIDEFVTESWGTVDSIDIREAMTYQDMEHLEVFVREGNALAVGETLLSLIDSQFVEAAEDELF